VQRGHTDQDALEQSWLTTTREKSAPPSSKNSSPFGAARAITCQDAIDIILSNHSEYIGACTKVCLISTPP
jgi:hypothetical protein